MIAPQYLASRSRLTVIKEDEILNEIEGPIVRKHAIEQYLRFHAPFVALVTPLPLGEMFPLAGNRAVAGAVAVANDEKSVVVESVDDNVLVEVIA